MAQFAPIEVLTCADDTKHGIVAPQLLILQRRNRNVENRKHQIGAAKLGFARQERLKFEAAMVTSQRAGGDDRYEKYRLADALLNLVFPERAERDCSLILPNPKIGLGTTELRAELDLNCIAEVGQPAPGALAVLTRIAEKPNKLWKISKRWHLPPEIDQYLHVRHVRSKKQLWGQGPFGTIYRDTCILCLAERAASRAQLIGVSAPSVFSWIPIVPSARHASVIFCGQICPWAMQKADKNRRCTEVPLFPLIAPVPSVGTLPNSSLTRSRVPAGPAFPTSAAGAGCTTTLDLQPQHRDTQSCP